MPDICRPSMVINTIITKLHILVLIFCILCVLFGKHTFIAFENLSENAYIILGFINPVPSMLLIPQSSFKIYLADTLLCIFLDLTHVVAGERLLVEGWSLFFFFKNFACFVLIHY